MIEISPENTTIGFVGTGVMGCPMALHLQEAGYALCVHNRTRSRAQPLVDGGAKYCETPGEVAVQ
ncbi:MAG: NAD(P)-binding domain-containing protein, partial [Verrucomicrobiota bacterium]